MRLPETPRSLPSREVVAPKFVWRGILWVRHTADTIVAYARGPANEAQSLAGLPVRGEEDLHAVAKQHASGVLTFRTHDTRPWDTVPWEIHEIEDDQIRRDVKRRFKQERRRFR